MATEFYRPNWENIHSFNAEIRRNDLLAFAFNKLHY